MNPSDVELAFKAGEMAIKLGMAVFEAVQAGQHSKTVGEIFEGVSKDLDELKRLRAEAEAHFKK